MSNQVFANNTSRYFPAVEQMDVLTLKKNIPGPPATGVLPIPLSSTSPGGIKFNRLNGVDLTAILGRWPYEQAQSPSTVPYYQLSSTPTILSGALMLTSKVNNTIAVAVNVPGVLTSPTQASQGVNLKMCLMRADSVNSLDKLTCISTDSFTIQFTSPTPIPNPPFVHCINAVASLLPGQVLVLQLYIKTSGSDWGFDMQDDTNSTSAVVIECSATFTKI